MSSNSNTCVNEVTSAISSMKMIPTSRKRNSLANTGDELERPSSTTQSPDTPILESPDNLLTDSFRLRMINFSAHSSQDNSSPTLQIPIVGYEVMEERARFTVYKLRIENKTSGDCWFVFRRYTDFVRLHARLRNDFPMIKLRLPRKRWFGDNFDPNFIEERILGLQDFVNGILDHPELYTVASVKDFFCLDEPPSYAESVEESRAIFEALEETIYHLRHQLKEKEMELSALKSVVTSEKQKKATLWQFIRDCADKCQQCSKEFSNLNIRDGPGYTSTPLKVNEYNAGDSTSPTSMQTTAVIERNSVRSSEQVTEDTSRNMS